MFCCFPKKEVARPISSPPLGHVFETGESSPQPTEAEPAKCTGSDLSKSLPASSCVENQITSPASNFVLTDAGNSLEARPSVTQPCHQSVVTSSLENSEGIVAERSVRFSSPCIASHIKKVVPTMKIDNKRSSVAYPITKITRRNAVLGLKLKNRRATVVDGLDEVVHLEEELDDIDEKELKLCPVPMQEKRDTRRNAINYELPKVSLKQKTTQKLNSIWQGVKQMFSFKPWEEDLKVIESHRGASVVSYFMFIRWLLFMNFIILALNLVFVVIPHAVSHPFVHRNNTGVVDRTVVKSHKDYETTINYANIQENIVGGENGNPEVVNHTIGFVQNLHQLALRKNLTELIFRKCSEEYQRSIKERHGDFSGSLQDFLQGTGAMESSLFFLGHYPRRSLAFAGHTINVPLTFILLSMAFTVICLLLMVHYSTHGIEEAFVKSKTYLNVTNDVLCAWDYCIQDKKAAELHRDSFYLQIKSDLFEYRQKREIDKRTRITQIKLFLIRFSVNILIISWIACCYYLIVKTISFQMEHEKDLNSSGIYTMTIRYLPSIVMMFLRTPSMLLFSFLVSYEKYTSQMAVNISIYRNAFLNLSSIVVVIITLKKNISCKPKSLCGEGWGSCKAPLCWETYIGQQLYKLAVSQIGFEIPYYLCYTIPQHFIVRKYHNKFTQLWGQPVFLLHFEVLWPIHAETILWLGVSHAPLLPCITILYLFLIFYVQKVIVLNYSALPSVQFRASRFNATFMHLLMVSFIIVTISDVHNLHYLVPSFGCGPFRLYRTMIGALNESLLMLPTSFIFLWNFILSIWFAVPVIILECAVVYYFWRFIIFLNGYEKKLKTELYLVTQDNQFLLGKINDITNES